MGSFPVSGRIALVTGGARGIGLETARALVARGATVVLADLDAGAAQDAAASLHASRAVGLAADVTDRGAVQRAVATTVERFGGLDVVVANAGIAPRSATLRAMTTESFDHVMDVNLGGVVHTVQAALPEIVRRRGHVVVVASAYAFTNGMGVIPYAMSKAAVEQLGRALRVELVQHGASASTAYFGFIDTEMVRQSVDGDPLVSGMLDHFPGPLVRRIPARAAGEAIARGIERRQAMIVRPRRWHVLSVLRGVVGPLTDRRFARDARTQDALRVLDSRAGEDQPTTR